MPALFTKLVGTTDKIAEEPQNTQNILKEFDKFLEVSFDLLLEVENAPIKEISEWREFILSN